jgi:HEAT repeat protein
MEKLFSLPLYKAAVISLSLSVLILFIGCSSKKDENSPAAPEPCVPAAASAPAPVDSNNLSAVSSSAADNNEPNKAPAVRSDSVGGEKLSPAAVLAELNTAGTDRKVELLESLSMLYDENDPNIINVAVAALDDANGEVGWAAISLLDGYEDHAIIPAVEKALNNEDEDVRSAAVELLANINDDDPQTANALALAINDPSEDVRADALDILENQDDPQPAVLEYGIASPYEEVKNAVLSILETRGDQKSVDILISGLKDQDPDFRAEVSDSIESLIDQKFDSYEEALAWWARNKMKFDEDLTPLD